MVSIASIGSHSALEISHGAAMNGLKSIVFCQKGREGQYYYYLKRKRKHSEVGVIDRIVLLDKFDQVVEEEHVKMMQEEGSIFVPNRSFCVYVGYEKIFKFPIPLFGNRKLLKAEERDSEKNQYWLMEKAGVRFPKACKDGEIDRPVIVKVSEAERKYERAFFIALDQKDFEMKGKDMVSRGIITREGLATARIEELVLGPQFNFNFFYSPLEEELELIGIDSRRQTNIDGFAKLPAWLQPKVDMKQIECGHIASTIRESLLTKVFEIGARIVEASQKEYKPGIIGPFAVQAMVTAEKGKEDIVAFDLSFRMPGSPGIKYTPYSELLFRKGMSMGERVALEIKTAEKEKEMDRVTT